MDRQEGNLLKRPGKRPEDGVIENHADVLVSDGHAYINYFSIQTSRQSCAKNPALQ